MAQQTNCIKPANWCFTVLPMSAYFLSSKRRKFNFSERFLSFSITSCEKSSRMSTCVFTMHTKGPKRIQTFYGYIITFPTYKTKTKKDQSDLTKLLFFFVGLKKKLDKYLQQLGYLIFLHSYWNTTLIEMMVSGENLRFQREIKIRTNSLLSTILKSKSLLSKKSWTWVGTGAGVVFIPQQHQYKLTN